MRFRRVASLAAVVAVLVVPQPVSAGSSGGVARVGQLGSALVAQVNAVRAAHGPIPLRVSPFLRAAANAHSTQMARLGYFSHDSANGSPFSSRIATYYPARGYRSWTVGENLLWASPDVGASRALKLWLSSPPHRANLLNPRWREIGLSAVHATRAPGVYGNAPTTIVTADFGARIR
ncbi:MAG TPA: CAP domain-containing protein [Gaiellaceae bacterium]